MSDNNHIFTIVLALMILLPAAALVPGNTGGMDLRPFEGNYLPVEPAEPMFVDHQAGRIVDDPVDPVLRERMDGADREDMIDMIISFKDEVRPGDISLLKVCEMQIIRVYTVVPAVHVIGPKYGAEHLANHERVFWMEFNEELVYMMQGTTTVINATKTWNSNILNFNGQDQGRIDGTGVTAVVLDSGIDAGHPDLDYRDKTIMNLKSDSGDGPWYEMENSDTSSGHGTHCAGTVGGNGEATGGARRGVAPGVKLIGLSTGEAFFITGALGALNWVYDHSKPGNNPHNIRVVSNSWGAGGGEYSPQDTISIASERIVYENNVAVVFAAGNSGGDGTDIQCSNYGNTPANICVAALEHDGGGVASFSSRGQLDLNGTWPDIGAPGVKIWSTAARRTLISTMTKQAAPTSFNPYYFAISGTSMATPHISGVCALLYQAYPGLGVSNTHDDYNGDEFPDWFNLSNTLVHETELILEASGAYIEANGDNGVPTDINATGWTGKPYDYAQGYGMAMVDRAVAIALTLKDLRTRDFDRDGMPDYPEATVMDAYNQYHGIMVKKEVEWETNAVSTTWHGEWVKFNNQTSNPVPYYTDEVHYLYIPEGSKEIRLSLSYPTLQTERPQVGLLRLVVDTNLDGNVDQSMPLNTDETKEMTIPISESDWGNTWGVNVDGQGIVLPLMNFFKTNQYYEARIEYTASAVCIFDQSSVSNSTIDQDNFHAIYGQWEPSTPEPGYANGTVSKEAYMFDLAYVHPLIQEEEPEPPSSMPIWPFILLILAVAAIAAAVVIYKKKKQG